MSNTDKKNSSDKFKTEEIYRRALGHPDADAPAATDDVNLGRHGRSGDYFAGDRTEPTLDDPSFPGSLDQSSAASPGWSAEPLLDPQPEAQPDLRPEKPSALPPVPSPQADDIAPVQSRQPAVFRWTLATTLTVCLSVALGLLLLVAPGRSPGIVDSPWLNRLLPIWAKEALMTKAGKPTVPPAAVERSPAAAEAGTAATADTPATASATGDTAVNAPGKAMASSTMAMQDAAPAAAGSTTQAGTNAGTQTPANSAPELAPAKQAPAQASADTTSPTAGNTKTIRQEATQDPNATAPHSKTAIPKANAVAAKRAPAAAAPRAAASRAEHDDAKTIRSAAPGSVFVQHVSLSTMADARAWRARHPALARARIVAVNTAGKGVKFAVVSGPFATRKQAEAFASRHGVPASPWFRPAASLRESLPSSRR